MRTIRFFLAATALAAVLALPVAGAEKTAKEIIDQMSSGFQNENMMMQFKMTLVDKSGQKRERTLRSRMREANDLAQSEITFEEPADVKGVKFLVLENKGRDDDQLIYLPANKRVRRITSSQRSTSFMGTDFSYNDLSTHESDKGKHSRLADEKLAGADCYVIESVPAKPEDYDYSRMRFWVRKDSMVVAKAEFYDMAKKLQKVMKTATFEEYKKGKWLAKMIKMDDVQKGTSTVIDVLKYKADAAIDDKYFTERFLKDESEM